MKERRESGGGNERNIFFLSLVLKVPRQCPLILLVEVCLREGEALGSKEVCKPERHNLSQGCIVVKLDLTFGGVP
jgi:hypothetical protein